MYRSSKFVHSRRFLLGLVLMAAVLGVSSAAGAAWFVHINDAAGSLACGIVSMVMTFVALKLWIP
jgi:hypothetical protein